MKRTIAIAVLLSACIIPDRDITFEGGPANPSAVRIIERTPLPFEVREICNAPSEPGNDLADLTFCPDVRRSLPSGLVRSPDGGPFCICPSGHDQRAISAFTIYAEDADLDGDSPRDTLLGVFLLDPDPFDEDPDLKVAFNEYRAFGEPGQLVPDSDVDDPDPIGGRTSPNQARDPVPQWAFRIDNSTGTVDLCNGADDIEPGLHDLQFMVTDRPWFIAPYADDDGGAPQYGVPDTAAGATYAVTHYIFECVDRLDEEDPRSAECLCDE